MSNPSLTPNTVPNGVSIPTTAQALIDFVTQYLILEGFDDLVGVVVSQDTPDVANQDKLWLKVDSTGIPQGIYRFATYWTLIPPVMEWKTSRPASPSKGQLFHDSALGVTLVFNGSSWVTLSGVSGDVKFVVAVDEAAALAKNPGWVSSTVAAPVGTFALLKS